MVIGKGYTDRFLTEAEVRELFEDGLGQIDTAGKKLLVILPDSTRSGPIPLCFRLFCELLQDSVAQLDFLIALGTHLPMSDAKINEHLGITAQERASKYANIGIYNHDWQNDVITIGTIPAAEIGEISGGLISK